MRDRLRVGEEDAGGAEGRRVAEDGAVLTHPVLKASQLVAGASGLLMIAFDTPKSQLVRGSQR